MSNLAYLVAGVFIVGSAIIIPLLALEVVIGWVFPKRDSKSHLGD